MLAPDLCAGRARTGRMVVLAALALLVGGTAGYRCDVTVVSAKTRPPASVPRGFNYGNGTIAVGLNPPNGRIVAGRLPSGGMRATINDDGSINAKVGWWRKGEGRPVITGRRLDQPAPALRASVPAGYSAGFQATGLLFPTSGCWQVTGRYGGAHLTFTVLVTKSRLNP
jgi:hypothetical protein